MQELLPCPFCGSVDSKPFGYEDCGLYVVTIEFDAEDESTVCAVQCVPCRIYGKSSQVCGDIREAIKQAIENWNKRAPTPANPDKPGKP